MSRIDQSAFHPLRKRIPWLQLYVTPLSARETAVVVLEYGRGGKGMVIGNLNLHGAFLYHTDSDFREYCESAQLILVDGAPIAWAGRISTRLRVGSTDWLDALMPLADGLRILAIGGTEEAALGTETYMRQRFPAVEWIGVDGFSSQAVGPELRALIREAHVVLVGMGMPLQEKWLLRHRDLLVGKVVANVGGCLDYYAGVQRLAPRWMGRLGVEWLYRLACDPRRLAYRYFVEPFKLAGVLIARAGREGDNLARPANDIAPQS